MSGPELIDVLLPTVGHVVESVAVFTLARGLRAGTGEGIAIIAIPKGPGPVQEHHDITGVPLGARTEVDLGLLPKGPGKALPHLLGNELLPILSALRMNLYLRKTIERLWSPQTNLNPRKSNLQMIPIILFVGL